MKESDLKALFYALKLVIKKLDRLRDEVRLVSSRRRSKLLSIKARLPYKKKKSTTTKSKPVMESKQDQVVEDISSKVQDNKIGTAGNYPEGAFLSMLTNFRKSNNQEEFFFRLDNENHLINSPNFVFSNYKLVDEDSITYSNYLSGFRIHQRHPSTPVIDCGESDPIYLIKRIEYLPLILPITSDGKFYKSIVGPKEYLTFRKFCSSVYYSNLTNEHSGLVVSMFSSQSLISGEALFRLLTYFATYCCYLIDKKIFDSNESAIKMDGFQVEEVPWILSDRELRKNLATIAPTLSMF